MRSLFTISITALLSSALPGVAVAQCNGGPLVAGHSTCTLAVTATAVINTVAKLSTTSLTTTLTAPQAIDFGTTAGVTTAGPTFTVKSNRAFALTASAATATWTGPAGTSKPASDLKMKVGAGGTIVALGSVGTSSAGTAGTSFDIFYNTIYNFATDKPGAYSLVVNYTLTAP